MNMKKEDKCLVLKCKLCGDELRLLKDPGEGMGALHGKCWESLGLELGVKGDRGGL